MYRKIDLRRRFVMYNHPYVKGLLSTWLQDSRLFLALVLLLKMVPLLLRALLLKLPDEIFPVLGSLLLSCAGDSARHLRHALLNPLLHVAEVLLELLAHRLGLAGRLIGDGRRCGRGRCGHSVERDAQGLAEGWDVKQVLNEEGGGGEGETHDVHGGGKERCADEHDGSKNPFHLAEHLLLGFGGVLRVHLCVYIGVRRIVQQMDEGEEELDIYIDLPE